MKIKNSKSGSLFRMLIIQYALFTLLVVLLFYGMLGLYALASNSVSGIPHDYGKEKLAHSFSSGAYQTLSADRLLGKGSYFEIVAKDGRRVYSSRPDAEPLTYTMRELACLPSLDGQSFCSMTKYKHAVLYDITQYDETFSQQIDSSLLVTDLQGRVMYSDYALFHAGDQLSLTEQQFLSGNVNDYLPESLAFRAPDKQVYRALLFFAPSSTRQLQTLDLLDRALGPVLIVGYIIIVLIFIVRLRKKVKKPLALLSDGMQQLADGSRGAQLSYRGPAEFEQMCQSFNRLSSRLRLAKVQQEQAEADKQKMLADISHDLKTPITVIQGYSKAIRDGIIPPDQTDRYLDTIYQKSTALTGLINTFYEYSQLAHPDFSLVLTRRDLCEYVREYLAAKYSEIELVAFSLELEIPETPLYCEIDTVQLRRVFENLLTNAIKHNPAGTRLHVVLTRPDEKNARIELADSGVGIPAALRDHIFDAFVVGDDSRATRQGSGLGLAICQKIVSAHGGAICLLPPCPPWVTRFEILLPLSDS